MADKALSSERDQLLGVSIEHLALYDEAGVLAFADR